ncbi:IS110 family transposase [Spirosoma oryzae]|nr:IS110 family transposase [Spirosoma oryzae]
MDFYHFVGIDISKDTLDWAVYTQQQGISLSIQTDNTLKGIKSALTQLKALPDWNSTLVVYSMEHTGIYNAHL